MQYDPTGEKYTISTLSSGEETYGLKLWASSSISFLYIGLYHNNIRVKTAEMDCQTNKVTSELWAGFVRELTQALEGISIDPDMNEKSLIEKIWELMAQIRLKVVDGHLAADIPEYVE